MSCERETEASWQVKNIMVVWVITSYSQVVCCRVYGLMEININTSVGGCNVWVGNNFERSILLTLQGRKLLEDQNCPSTRL
jgi:hypothetical protein